MYMQLYSRVYVTLITRNVADAIAIKGPLNLTIFQSKLRAETSELMRICSSWLFAPEEIKREVS